MHGITKSGRANDLLLCIADSEYDSLQVMFLNSPIRTN